MRRLSGGICAQGAVYFLRMVPIELTPRNCSVRVLRLVISGVYVESQYAQSNTYIVMGKLDRVGGLCLLFHIDILSRFRC